MRASPARAAPARARTSDLMHEGPARAMRAGPFCVRCDRQPLRPVEMVSSMVASLVGYHQLMAAGD